RLGWKSSVGGNRRGGVNNQGVGSSQGTNSLLPRQVWTFSDNWTGPTSSDFATVDNVAAAPTLGTDANRLLKEPLCAANGIVYVQYEDNGTYWLCAVDAKPEEDLDGDGQADDGPIRDVANYGATSDTIWRRDMGSTPIAGATGGVGAARCGGQAVPHRRAALHAGQRHSGGAAVGLPRHG
ncbi:MAG: hypothetical protein M5U09_03615, partial [Gammaproteobacteria bacterium]|nr:hypothetical protein [Gammaproteobacteria bacterium]